MVEIAAKWMRHLLIAISLVIFTVAAASTGCTRFPDRQAKLELLYAGSLVKVQEKGVKPEFERKTGIEVKGQGYGALTCAKLMKEGLRKPDVFISADSQVIEQELMGNRNGNLVKGYISFISNRMVIAYSRKSRYFEDLERARRGEALWYEVLARKGFRFGRTDPDLNPKGYRMIFAAKLAEDLYGKPGLAAEILKEKEPLIYGETELMSRLEFGDVDAAEAYANEAIERNLPYIELPSAVNLGDPDYAANYAKVAFRSKTGRIYRGAPIMYTLAIPENAKHKKEAAVFVRFLLSQEGRDLYQRFGFTPIPINTTGSIPAELKGIVR